MKRIIQNLIIVWTLVFPFLAQAEKALLKSNLSVAINGTLNVEASQAIGEPVITEKREIENFEDKTELTAGKKIESDTTTKSTSYRRVMAAGHGSDGGGFAFRYTSRKHYEFYKAYLSKKILNISTEKFKELGQEFHVALDWEQQKKFSEVIRTASPSMKEKISDVFLVDPVSGEPYLMDKDLEKGTIRALPMFFQTFNYVNLPEELRSEMVREILHEAAHILRIGIDNNDDDAWNFSTKMRDLVTAVPDGKCGANGSVEERESNCNVAVDGKDSKWRLVTSEVFNFGLMLNLKDEKSKLLINYFTWQDSRPSSQDQCSNRKSRFFYRPIDTSWELPTPQEAHEIFEKILGALPSTWIRWNDSSLSNRCIRTNIENVVVCADGSEKTVRTDFVFENAEKHRILCIGR